MTVGSCFSRWSTAQFTLNGKPGGCLTAAFTSIQKQPGHCWTGSTLERLSERVVDRRGAGPKRRQAAFCRTSLTWSSHPTALA